MLCGAECAAIRKGDKFSYNEQDASDWMDDMGGVTSPKVSDMIMAVVSAINPGGEDKGESKEEDKKDTAEKKIPVGESSTSSELNVV